MDCPIVGVAHTCAREELSMKTMKFTYWQDGRYYLGFLNEYPDYQTQGMSKDELVSNLKALLTDLSLVRFRVPGKRKSW